MISKRDHIPIKTLVEELERRETILRWMVSKGTSSYDEVADLVRSYYLIPEEIYSLARMNIQ
jgi:hypothetical protein